MRIEKDPRVCILASQPYGTLYIGVTSDLCSRISLHKQKLIQGFSKTYNVTQLAFHERLNSMEDAIRREKQMKEWKRGWKIQLIEKDNPRWLDLFVELCGSATLPTERKLTAVLK